VSHSVSTEHNHIAEVLNRLSIWAKKSGASSLAKQKDYQVTMATRAGNRVTLSTDHGAPSYCERVNRFMLYVHYRHTHSYTHVFWPSPVVNTPSTIQNEWPEALMCIVCLPVYHFYTPDLPVFGMFLFIVHDTRVFQPAVRRR